MNRPIGTVIPGGEPKITIRIIGRCNFHCPSCSTASHPGRKGLMLFSDFKKIIVCLQKEDFSGVLNLSGGEPTLHKNLVKMVRFAASHLTQSKIVIFTNGTWIGKPWWRHKLQNLLTHPNTLVRLSLDRQHVMGALNASGLESTSENIRKTEAEHFAWALAFKRACLSYDARPGTDFDFAFKGSRQEAATYLAPLGNVPVYSIAFQKKPASRPKKYGYFGIDINAAGKPIVFPTLGHILKNKPLGGIEQLPRALELNRRWLRENFQQLERQVND